LIDAPLVAALRGAARASRLLVACDYDGTLAPIVGDPAAAFPYGPAVDALADLARYAGVGSVIISGRSVDTLLGFVGTHADIELIGDHGVRLSGNDPVASRTVREITKELKGIADEFEGATVEPKPLGAAFHYRHVAQPEQAADAARTVGARFDARVLEGKKVVEIMVGHGDKGSAISHMRKRDDFERVVFFGDDVTDEDVFAILDLPDVGVKVGPGGTRATHRVGDPKQVAEALEILGSERRLRTGE